MVMKMPQKYLHTTLCVITTNMGPYDSEGLVLRKSMESVRKPTSTEETI